MKVIKWGKKQLSEPGMMLQLSPEEAISLIESLSAQLGTKSPNTGRKEYRLEDGMYFSVAVQQPSKYTPDEMEIGYTYERIEQAGKWESGDAAKILNKGLMAE